MRTHVVSLESWYEELSPSCYHSLRPIVGPLNGLITRTSMRRILHFCRRRAPSEPMQVILMATEHPKLQTHLACASVHCRHMWVNDFTCACVRACTSECALCSPLLYSQASAQRRSQAWSGLAGFQAWRLAEAVSVCFVGAAMRTGSRGQAWRDTEQFARHRGLDNSWYYHSYIYNNIKNPATTASL